MKTEQIQSTEFLSDGTMQVNAEESVAQTALASLQMADYQLEEKLGAGGYGEVWRAIGPGGLPKAVKVLYGHRDGEHAEAELKSLERMRELRHPFLLSIERIEVVDSRLIVVTELADGNLTQRFEECRQNGMAGIPRDELLGYLKDAADALDFMSAQHGLQHLDIKPDNILIQGNHAKVGDFGMAKDINSTNISVVSGFTPLYAPPELFEGRPGRTTDQYSLAIVYQTLLTGKPPFSGRTAAQLTAQHLRSQPDLADLQPIDRPVIARALSKKINSRYDNCRQFVDELARRKHSHGAAKVLSAANVQDALHRTALVKTQGGININDAKDQPSTPIKIQPVQTTGKSLRRSVFIGVGGLGGSVLRSLKVMITGRRSQESAANFPLLQIDTNRESLSLLRSTSEEPGLSAEETVSIPLRSSKQYRSATDLDLSWISRRWLFNIPRSGQVDGIRPLGRLALCDHHRAVEEKVAHAIASASSNQFSEEVGELCEVEIGDSGVDVYIVGSTSGGTSSGMIADLGLIVRRIVKMQSLENVEVHGLLLHGTGAMRNVAELQEANTACLLKELRHLSTPGLGTVRGFDRAQPMVDEIPFDNIYFVSFGDRMTAAGVEKNSQDVAKFLLDSATTAAQLDYREWRTHSEHECHSPDEIRLLGIGLQDAESFHTAAAHSNSLCSLLLRRWCDSADQATKRSEFPEQLTDSLTVLAELQLTETTLPQQVMKVLRGSVGNEIESFAAEVNDSLVISVTPETVTRREVLDFLGQRLSATAASSGMPTLHSIVSDVQTALSSQTRSCQEAINTNLLGLLNTPDRLEAPLTAAKFMDIELAKTHKSCESLLKEIESAFNALVLDGESSAPLIVASQMSATEQLKAFCQQYCVLLAYQTIYQCFLNHVSNVRRVVAACVDQVQALREELDNFAKRLADNGDSDDVIPPPIVDAFDRNLRSLSPTLLSDHCSSSGKDSALDSKVTSAATRFLVAASQGNSTGATEPEPKTDFPRNAWPGFRGLGGRRRVLAQIPDGMDQENWNQKLNDEFDDCVVQRSVADSVATVVCELEGIPIDAILHKVTQDNPHISDIASRIHTRRDIDW